MIRTLEGLFNVLLWFFSPTNHSYSLKNFALNTRHV